MRVLAQAKLDWEELDTSLVERVREADPHRVRAIASAYAEGVEIPPIVVLLDEKTVVDGLHRIEAHRKWSTYIEDQPPPKYVLASILNVPPDSPEKWLLVVEHNSPTMAKPLSAPEVVRAIQGYISEVSVDSPKDVKKVRKELIKWAEKIKLPKRIIYDVLSAQGLSMREVVKQTSGKPREAGEQESITPPAIVSPPPIQTGNISLANNVGTITISDENASVVQVPLFDTDQLRLEASIVGIIHTCMSLHKMVSSLIGEGSLGDDLSRIWTVADVRGVAEDLEEAAKSLIDFLLRLVDKR